MASTTPTRVPALKAIADLPSVSVQRVMRAGVVSVAANASLLQVAQAMSAHGVHAVLVLDPASPARLGWVTTAGLIPRLVEVAPFARAADAVTEPATVIPPHSSVADAIRELARPGVTHLIVANGPGALPQGIVSDTDIVRFAASRV